MTNCEFYVDAVCTLRALFRSRFDRPDIGFYWFQSSFLRSDAFHHILFSHSICIFICRDGTKHSQFFLLETNISHLGKAGNFRTVAHCIEIANGDQTEACCNFPQSALYVFELLRWTLSRFIATIMVSVVIEFFNAQKQNTNASFLFIQWTLLVKFWLKK